MFALQPANVIDELVKVLDSELGSVRIWPDIQTCAEVLKGDVGELIEPWELLGSHHEVLVEAVEAESKFVGDRR